MIAEHITVGRVAPDHETVQEAGLHFVTDRMPGLRRTRAGGGFHYQDSEGRAIRDDATLKRIRSLAIPPAWTNVWICPLVNGHLQATGRDARSRKQYRYHRRWREARDDRKFGRMIAFGRVLPKIRRRVRRDLRAPGLGREKVLATIVRLLDLSAIRVGNDEYASQNSSYGLTTLRNRHVRVQGQAIHLRFRGKGGKLHQTVIEHPAVARVVKKCQELPGQELFEWVDDQGRVHDVTSGHVNEYLAEITGRDFTSKDFRTWTGTVLAAGALGQFARAGSPARMRASIARAIEQVAGRLGNTPAVCRKCYVHPAVLSAFCDGTLHRALGPKRHAGRFVGRAAAPLRSNEKAILALLKRQRDQTGDRRLSQRLELSLKRLRRF